MVLVVTAIDIIFLVPSMIRGDMPGGVLALLISMTGAVYGGYFGTSCAEDYTAKKYAKGTEGGGHDDET
jgi:hypothetical protein